jgi:hypothetical protein
VPNSGLFFRLSDIDIGFALLKPGVLLFARGFLLFTPVFLVLFIEERTVGRQVRLDPSPELRCALPTP